MNPLFTRPNRWRPITVFNLLVGLFFSLSAMAQPAFLKEGLVAYYPLNGNASDESGNGYHATVIGADLSTNRFGIPQDSYFLNGSAQYILTPTFAGLPVGKNDFSVSVWVCPSKMTSANHYMVFANGQQNQFQLDIDTAMGSVNQFGASATLDFFTGGNGNAPDCQTIVVPWITGKWYNVHITRSNNNIVIYRDAVKIGENATSDGNTASDSRIAFGYRRDYRDFGFFGKMDDVRIYNRALSDGEVKALYDYESTPNPRIASATAQVVNGFVVGGTITDGGYGYVSNPVVTITGGGGTGAKATALQVDGVVTSITITNPGSGYTSTPYITIAPPPFPPRKATSSAQIVNGFVVGTKITDSGFGYDSPPAVLIVGGDGSGATAVATVANGVVTTITITNPGTGYTSVPIVRIASPPFAPKLGIETSKVYVRMSVVLGRKYQLEASTDLNTWTSTGPTFIAQDEELAQEFDVNRVGRYFRINQVP